MRPRLVLGILVAVVALAAAARAAAPYDTYREAWPVSAGEEFPTVSTLGAGHADEPRPCGFIGRTVWFEWTAPAAGVAVLDTAGSDFDTVVAAYPTAAGGAPRADTEGDGRPDVPCADDAGDGGDAARLVWPVVATQRYLFQAGGFAGDAGTLRARLDLRPPNDAFAAATPLAFRATAAGVRADAATTEPGEPFPCGALTRTVWYSWAADRNGPVAVHTFGSDADTVLAAYTGSSITSLRPVACDDDSRATEHSRVQLDVSAGTRYRFQVGTKDDRAGPLAIVVEPLTPNDLVDEATVAAALPFHHEQSTHTAGTSADEPYLHGADCMPAGLALGQTVWFRWTATDNDTVVADTLGSDHDTLLAVFDHRPTRTSAYLECNNDAGAGAADLASRKRFVPTPGTEYWFLVGAVRLDPEDRTFSTLAFNLVRAPPNDLREAATAIYVDPPAIVVPGDPVSVIDPGPTPLPLRVTAWTRGAWNETPAPGQCPELGADVWYRFWPATDGVYEVATHGSSFDTALAVDGGACSDDADGGPWSRVRFLGNASAPTLLRVGGRHGATGLLSLAIRDVRPDHDESAAARPLVGGHARAVDDVAGATARDEPEPCGATVTGSVWYSWTATASREFVVDTVDSGFPTAVAVWKRKPTGEPGDPVGCSAADAGTARERVRFHATLGAAYLVQVGRVGSLAVEDRLVLDVAPYLIHSARDSPVVVETLPFVGSYETAGARPDVSEPEPCDATARASLWFRWTAPPDIVTTTFDVRGSDHAVSLTIRPGVSPETKTCLADATRHRFEPTPGQEYEIQVSDAAGTSGTTTLLVEARPENDDFEDAETLSQSLGGGFNVTKLDTSGATVEAGEPRLAECGAPAATVWYRWTLPPPEGPGGVPQKVRYVLDTLGSTHDTVLAVYQGETFDDLALVACNDDRRAGEAWSRVVLDAVEGGTYRIQVGGAGGAVGDLELTRAVPPPHDDPRMARELDYRYLFRTKAEQDATRWATTQEGEAAPCGGIENSVWFTWTAPPIYRRTREVLDRAINGDGAVPADETDWIEQQQDVNASTFGSDFDTVLSVYVDLETAPTSGNVLGDQQFAAFGGRFAPLIECNDDFGTSPQSRVEFSAQQGTRYLFQVGGADGAVGNLRFGLNGPIINDWREDALVIVGVGSYFEQDFFGSSPDPEYPHQPDAGGRTCSEYYEYLERTVWYRWVAESDGNVVLDTTASSSDPITALYVGDETTPERCARSGPLSFPTVRGTEYWFQFLNGWDMDRLRFTLARAPANDVRSGAVRLPDGVVDATFAEYGATDATDDTGICRGISGGGLTGTTWFRWRPGSEWRKDGSSDPKYSIHTYGSSFDSTVSVFRDDGGVLGKRLACGRSSNLTTAASSPSIMAQAEFAAVGSDDHWIVIGRPAGSADTGRVRIAIHPVVKNDAPPDHVPFADAYTLVGRQFEVASTTRGATAETGFAPYSQPMTKSEGVHNISVNGNPVLDPFLGVLGSPTIGAGSFSCQERGPNGVRTIPQAATVWYAWTAPERSGVPSLQDGAGPVVVWAAETAEDQEPRARLATANTFGSTDDTLLSVWAVDSVKTENPAATVTLRGQLVCSDDHLSAQSRVRFLAVDGETYFLMVGSKDPLGGAFRLNLPAANDDRDSATLVRSTGSAEEVDPTGATVGPDEPFQEGCTAARTLWWRWVAPAGGRVTASAEAGGGPVSLAMYAHGARTPLAPCVRAAPAASVGWTAEAGATYLFQVGTDALTSVAFGLSVPLGAAVPLLLAAALSTIPAARRRRGR